MIEDEALEISRKQSKAARDERLAGERGMLRLLTPTEEDALRQGLQQSEVLDVQD